MSYDIQHMYKHVLFWGSYKVNKKYTAIQSKSGNKIQNISSYHASRPGKARPPGHTTLWDQVTTEYMHSVLPVLIVTFPVVYEMDG